MADINSPAEFLQEAIELIDALNTGRDQLKADTAERERIEKELDSLRRNIENEKLKTTESRRSDVENEFDKKLKAKDAEIEKLEAKRSKARKEGVNNRVVSQTAGLKGDIKTLKGNLKEYCSQNKLPAICRTRMFYRLYYPAGLGNWLMLLVITAVMIAALFGAYIYNRLPVFIAVVAVDILIIAVYAAVWNATKGRYHEQLKACRQIIAAIRNSEKGVKNVTKNIIRDKSDEAYDLGSFDNDIAVKRQEKSELQSQKSAALYQFDTVTKQQLTSDIDNAYAGRLSELETACSVAKQKENELGKKLSDMEIRLNSEIVPYIGSSNMTHAAAEEMLELVKNGEAVSVSEAAAKIKERHN